VRRVPAKQKKKEQTRAKLVEAALRVFALQGYDHATVEEIALAAGYSKGAYYFHFDSKEAIFLELLSMWIEEQTRRLELYGTASEPPAVALLSTIESLLRYDNRDPHWRSLLPEFWAQAHRNDRVCSALRKAYDRWLELLQAVFDSAVRQRLLPLAVSSPVAAGLVLAAHDGLIVHRQLRPSREKEPPLTQTLAALMSTLTVAPTRVAMAQPRAVKRAR